MSAPLVKVLSLAAAVALSFSLGIAAATAATKHKTKRAPVRHQQTTMVPVDENGTPIIMQGYHPPKRTLREARPSKRAERRALIPYGSSTYIPPPVPAPNSPNSPPAAYLTRPPPPAYQPPPITTFSDRVGNAIHAYPLERGLGNNPLDQQMFIRQRANQ